MSETSAELAAEREPAAAVAVAETREPAQKERKDRSAWWLTGLLALLMVSAKLVKWQQLAPEEGLADLLVLFAEDTVVLSLIALLFLWLRARAHIWLRNSVYLLFALIALVGVIEHGFFMSTGAVGDGYLLLQGISRFDELKRVFWSEMNLVRVIALLIAPISALLVYFYYRRTAPETSLRGWLPVTVIGALALVVAIWPKELGGEISVLRPNYVRTLLQDSTALLLPVSDSALEGSDAILDPIELTPVEGAPAKAKNVVLVVLESTSAKGASVNRDTSYPLLDPSMEVTPFLDELAKRGGRAERAYSTVPHTSKALVGINCGIYPYFDVSIFEAEGGGVPTACLARLLREQGYATGYFQSAEENYEKRSELVGEFGFEHFVGKESLDSTGFDESSYFGYEDDVLVKPLIEWAKQQSKPFFAEALTVTGHHPYAVPRGFERKEFVKDERTNDYLNTLAYMDRFVRKLHEGMKKAGLLEDTIFVVTGDHGEAFAEHGRYQHDSTAYDEMMRVPLVIEAPTIEPGTVFEGTRQHIDIVPTLVELLGFAPSRPFLGKSLLNEGHDSVFVHCYYQDFCRAQVRGKYKFIDNYGRRRAELYDLEADPKEEHDLGAEDEWQKEIAARSAEMKKTTDEWRARYQAQSETRLEAFVTERVPRIPNAANTDFGPIILVGSHLSTDAIVAGGKVMITLFFYVKEKPDPDLKLFVHVHNEDDMINADHVPVGGAYPISEWKPGQYVRDRFPIGTRPRAKLGEYKIYAGFYSNKGGRLTPSGGRVDDNNRVRIDSFEVKSPDLDLGSFVSTKMPATGAPVNIPLTDALTIVGAQQERERVRRDLKFKSEVIFKVNKDLPSDALFKIRLDGPSPTEFDYAPHGGAMDPADWEAGQYIRDRLSFITIRKALLGKYDVYLQLWHDEKMVGETEKPIGSYRLDP